MRTAFLESERRIVLADLEKPTIQSPDQILIRVEAVGICGSEVHAYEGTHPYRVAPVILGHETSGVVEEVGATVSKFKVGDRVTIDPQWVCGECQYCRAGDINLCPSKRVLGTDPWPGAFGEYIVVPEKTAFALPDSLSYIQGALVEPLTVAVHVAHRVNVGAGTSVAILGSGSIGGLLSGVCRERGANPIIVADIRQHCMDAAIERLGATHDFLLPDETLVTKVKEATGGEGVETVFIAADDVTLVNRAIEMVKPRGVIVLIALLTHAPLKLNAYDITGKEKHILGSSMSNHQDVHEAIQLAASGKVDVEGILTHIMPIEEAPRGMELACTKDDGAIKVVLTYS